MHTIRSLAGAALLALAMLVGPSAASESCSKQAGTGQIGHTAEYGMKGPYSCYSKAKNMAYYMAKKYGYKSWVMKKGGYYYCCYQ